MKNQQGIVWTPLLIIIGAVVLAGFAGYMLIQTSNANKFDPCSSEDTNTPQPSSGSVGLGPSKSPHTECLLAVAVDKQDISFCENIVGDDIDTWLVFCVSQVAIASENPAICSRLSPDLYQEECRQQYQDQISFNNDARASDANAAQHTTTMQQRVDQGFASGPVQFTVSFHIGHAGSECTRQYYLKAILRDSTAWLSINKEEKTAVVKKLLTIASAPNPKQYSLNVYGSDGQDGYVFAEKKCEQSAENPTIVIWK